MIIRTVILFLFSSIVSYCYASINVDRTRIVFEQKTDAISMTLSNNAEHPYLAQAWIENEKGEKSSEYFVVIPPIQRIEANSKNQIKILKSVSHKLLSEDQESLFYLKIKEIPPKPIEGNIIQIALQSQLKIFYRPTNILTQQEQSWLKEITVIYANKTLTLINPTAYYINIADVIDKNGEIIIDVGYNMLAPFSSKEFILTSQLSDKFQIGYIDDYGALRLFAYLYENKRYSLQNEG
ncbi:molecular chaperone [Moellerella wisconsensis]|uniref:fimbrial biogenesis chaperone n=1 Tax=Moellerella wisconsensis TaxID=158849 RepID=UPI00307673D3